MLRQTEIDDLHFDAQLMGFRVVYIKSLWIGIILCCII